MSGVTAGIAIERICKHLSCLQLLKFCTLLFCPHSVLILALVWWLPKVETVVIMERLKLMY
jgi:hypothetical protein